MSSWVDRNKAWILAALLAMVPAIGGFYTLNADVKTLDKKLCEVDVREQAETKRANGVDTARTGQVARIETKLEYIQRDVGRIEAGQQQILQILRENRENRHSD